MTADKQARYLHVTGCSGSGKTLLINKVLRYLQPAGDREDWKFVTVDAYQAQTVQLFCRSVYEVNSLDQDVY
jgi:Ni2+-binding GTPase involved in maturation of urease and hydrogenase